MKTTFILHGGMLKYDNPHNKTFFEEFTKNLNDGDTVLFVGFARQDEVERQSIYESDTGYIRAHTEKNLVFENAQSDTLVEQANQAQAIFVTGGDTEKLRAEIAAHPDFLEAIKGKVYAGTSAGAMIAATYMYACTANEVREGLGWLPIRLMVHYGNSEFNSTEETLKKLEQYPNDLELVVLPECEWQVVEVEL